MRMPSPARVLAGTHAAYLVGSGLWGVLHRGSFERVTGRKRDFWLVRLVGALAAVTGAALGVSVVRGRASPESRTLALGSTLAFGAADVYAGRRYSRVYAADALAQLLFAAGWVAPWKRTAAVEQQPARAVVPAAPPTAPSAPPADVDDDLLAARVRDALEPVVDEVDVEVTEGVVKLRGAVESEDLVDELVRRIEAIPDVRGIDPHLSVSAQGASR